MKRTTYRIYTESSPEYDAKAQALVGEYFDGFTMIHGTGVWEGTTEPCLIIEIIADDWNAGVVARIAALIKRSNGQDAVIVTRQDVEFNLIDRS